MKRMLLYAVIISVLAAPAAHAKKDRDPYEALKPLMEVYAIIQESYVDTDKTDPDDLVQGAIKGMVTNLDPFSQYLDVQSYKDMNDDTKAEFGGLGIEISLNKDGQLIVVSPIEDTPAFKAGILAGDKIMQIEGESTDGLTVMDAVHKLRGEPGTKVTISIQRGNAQEWKDYTITRAIIKVQTVRFTTIGEDTGYIRINEFMGKAAAGVSEALDDFSKKKINKVVIDLRNNPGGLLDEAVRISEFFLPKDTMIVSTSGRDQEKAIKFRSEKDRKYKGRLVLIINEGSASASEILAGAMQDNKRAVIIGSRSFGKGSVQTIIPLSDKSALRITTAKYFTPNGKQIHGVGIKPDIELKEPVPTAYTVSLYDKGYFEEFASEFLKKNPEGLNGKEKSNVNVSEKDIKRIYKKGGDEDLLESFVKFVKTKDAEADVQEIASDRESILKNIKTEIGKKQGGRLASKNAAIENDIQIKRAVDILNTMDILAGK